jgi:hypothetical protein
MAVGTACQAFPVLMFFFPWHILLRSVLAGGPGSEQFLIVDMRIVMRVPLQ